MHDDISTPGFLFLMKSSTFLSSFYAVSLTIV